MRDNLPCKACKSLFSRTLSHAGRRHALSLLLNEAPPPPAATPAPAHPPPVGDTPGRVTSTGSHAAWPCASASLPGRPVFRVRPRPSDAPPRGLTTVFPSIISGWTSGLLRVSGIRSIAAAKAPERDAGSRLSLRVAGRRGPGAGHA